LINCGVCENSTQYMNHQQYIYGKRDNEVLYV
jgi:hypothetical protein